MYLIFFYFGIKTAFYRKQQELKTYTKHNKQTKTDGILNFGFDFRNICQKSTLYAIHFNLICRIE